MFQSGVAGKPLQRDVGMFASSLFTDIMRRSAQPGDVQAIANDEAAMRIGAAVAVVERQGLSDLGQQRAARLCSARTSWRQFVTSYTFRSTSE